MWGSVAGQLQSLGNAQMQVGKGVAGKASFCLLATPCPSVHTSHSLHTSHALHTSHTYVQTRRPWSRSAATLCSMGSSCQRPC